MQAVRSGGCGSRIRSRAVSAIASRSSLRKTVLSRTRVGWIDTPFNRPAIDLMGGDQSHGPVGERIVRPGRQGTPEEGSPIHVLPASEKARHVGAMLMMVDGGMAHQGVSPGTR